MLLKDSGETAVWTRTSLTVIYTRLGVCYKTMFSFKERAFYKITLVALQSTEIICGEAAPVLLHEIELSITSISNAADGKYKLQEHMN